jgi:hypothetical protein
MKTRFLAALKLLAQRWVPSLQLTVEQLFALGQ